jgi:hypothetical protein
MAALVALTFVRPLRWWQITLRFVVIAAVSTFVFVQTRRST